MVYPEPAAFELADMVDAAGLSLALPKATVTYHERGNTMIDLIFISESLEQSLYRCSAAAQLDHGSDHLPILTEFSLDPMHKIIREKWAWHKMDDQAVQAEAEKLWIPTAFTSQEEIDSYAQYLVDFTVTTADLTTPRIKPS